MDNADWMLLGIIVGGIVLAAVVIDLLNMGFQMAGVKSSVSLQ